MALEKYLLVENVGGYDLFIRSVAGSLAIVVLALDWVTVPPWNWLLAIIAVVGLFSGMTRHCTPYVFIGYSTKRA
ncbi:MAG TPA: DUF2892 domain-containing protein [Desulfobacteria bacterium]|nr:DUF2892 domain-containing protein [Desulfobacteria bacterium]